MPLIKLKFYYKLSEKKTGEISVNVMRTVMCSMCRVIDCDSQYERDVSDFYGYFIAYPSCYSTPSISLPLCVRSS